MAVPKKRTSRSRKNMRRAHDALTFSAVVMVCPHCGADKLRHRVCASCGFYRGRLMFQAAGAEGLSAASEGAGGAEAVAASDEPADGAEE